MKLFSKKKDDELFITDNGAEAFSVGEKSAVPSLAPNVLTPEEILGKESSKTVKKEDGVPALELLQRKMAAQEGSQTDIADNVSNKGNTDTGLSSLSDKVSETLREMSASLDKNVKTEKSSAPKEKPKSLFDKCRPYIEEDGENVAVNAEPLYKLQSVAEILKSDSEKALERLSEKYEISFDDLGRPEQSKKNRVKPKSEEVSRASKPERPEASSFEDTVPMKNQVRNIQSSVASVISDIDVPEHVKDTDEDEKKTFATITFTPVTDSTGTNIGVTSNTRSIDLTGELTALPRGGDDIAEERVKLEKSEFEEFVPEDELCSETDLPRLVRKYSLKKRRAFLQSVFTFILTALLAVTELPPLAELISEHNKTVMIVCTSVTAVAVLINYDIFASIGKIFKGKCSTDIAAASASLFTLLYAVFGIIRENLTVNMLLLLGFILFFRALGTFFDYSRMLSNLKVIGTAGNKRAVRLIDDSAVTFAMARNAVEGDALIAAPQKTDAVEDYVKYSVYGNAFGGKISLITVLSLILSAAVGIACASYFDGAVYGLYAAAAVQCFTALPVLFLVERLPNYGAAKRLNPKGAMIAGRAGAERIEAANAAVFGASDFFPSGTVSLRQMKVLSENDLQDTIIRAASLTESLDSPLTSIFKKIAGTGNITVFPDSDTVKYEEKMGISGWVDNRLLFIGNRTLMEAHGISVPSVEVDRAILRQGCFPVYVATRDRACALLAVHYSVDPTVARELRRLTGLGVTLLVNSSDPNLTEEMLCDYFGLYEDCVTVMSAAGCHMYRNTVVHKKSVSAPAAYRANPIALASIINCASKIRRSNILLTAAYIICAAVGILVFTFASLGGSGNLLSEGTLLLYGIISTAASYLLYLIEKP